ncbi:DUF2397 domain-containing protein [Lentzea chajnantorensis]
MTRNHLAPEEIAGFRSLLVEYIQRVVEDVLKYTPPIAAALAALAKARSELLRLLGTDLGAHVERARGRTPEDWQELTDWFVDRPGRPSQVTALREATARAIGSLLASVKRATSGGGLLPGRRAELLKLASWFDGATREEAHEIYASAFGLYSSRHLSPAPEHDSDNERTPWRDGPVCDVTVSVRSRGDRGGRGRPSRILDDPMTEQSLLAEAREAEEVRARHVAELTSAAGNLGGTTLSHGALEVFCELLTLAMAQRDSPRDSGSASDPVRGLKLAITPGTTTQIRSAAGTLTLHDATVVLER